MRNPILIGSAIGFIAFAIMAILDIAAKVPNDISTYEAVAAAVTVGTFFGIVGSVVGGLIGIPFYLVFKNDREQDQIEQHQPLEISGTDPVVGLWRSRRTLIIDPETAVFPARCIFSNAAISHFLPFKVGQIDHSSAGPIHWVKKRTTVEFLPVSASWLEQQRRRGRTIQLLLLPSSLVLFVLGCFISLDLFAYGILLFIIAVALPRLSGVRRQIGFAARITRTLSGLLGLMVFRSAQSRMHICSTAIK